MSHYAVIERVPDGRERILGVGFSSLGWPDDEDLWSSRSWACTLVEERLLADGLWREVGPLGPRDMGDIGGDGQLSDAWGRRFALRTRDGLWAVVDHFFYVETDVMHETGQRWLTEGIWRTVCRDLRDVDGTEEWAGMPECEALNTVGEVTDRDAYGRAELLDGEYAWDGAPLEG